MFKTFRRMSAALLITILTSLTVAAPAHAWGVSGRRSFDGPARTAPERGLFAFLLHLFDFTGGAMDPNGNS